MQGPSRVAACRGFARTSCDFSFLSEHFKCTVYLLLLQTTERVGGGPPPSNRAGPCSHPHCVSAFALPAPLASATLLPTCKSQQQNLKAKDNHKQPDMFKVTSSRNTITG